MLSTETICEMAGRRGLRDSQVEVPAETKWEVPEGKNPWKNSAPFSAQEIEAILLAGIKANQPVVLAFQPVEFSKDLVPAAPLRLPAVPPGKCSDQTRGHAEVFTWLPTAKQSIELEVTGGLIPRYRNRGNVSFRLYAEQEATLEAVARDASVPPDGKPRRVALKSPYAGLHWLEWTDGSDRTRVVPPDSLPWTFRATLEDKMPVERRWSLYFYVPRGTKVIGGYASAGGGWVVNPQGKRVFKFDELRDGGQFSVPVPAGEDGSLWEMEDVAGTRALMTVPPYFARSAETLLLPKEVVHADAKNKK
jgi:hypothetical protein